jgi:hypothetical protein
VEFHEHSLLEKTQPFEHIKKKNYWKTFAQQMENKYKSITMFSEVFPLHQPLLSPCFPITTESGK